MHRELVIGTREVWGRRQPFGLSRADRRHHLYIIGQTGTGKSTLMRELFRQDIEAGEGCALFDPHGDLAEDVLDLVPRRRTDDVVLFEPADLAHPIALNPFYRVPPDERALVASNLTAAFKHLWRDSWGPRLEYVLYNTLAAVLDAPDHLRPTILSVPRMLVDSAYRAAVVEHIADPQVRQFWTAEFASWSERFLAEAIAPAQNKVGAIVSAASLRNVLGQWRPTIDLARVMEERKILIASLPKGRLGEDKANLIGSLLVAGFQSAAMRRAGTPPERRTDFHLYLDEFHNFGTDAFSAILSEARKFGLTLCLAHQFLAQLDEAVSAAVFGNVGSIVSFRVGAADAEIMAREISEYRPDMLRGLARGSVCARTLSGGEVQQPFLGETVPGARTDHGRTANIRTQSRQRYCRPRKAVEQRIIAWLSPPSRGAQS